jgi:hypothetical protein
MSDILSTSTVEPSRGGGFPRVLFEAFVLAWLSRRTFVPRLATLNIFRGRRFPPATAYVQFSRIDNEGEYMSHEQEFASPAGSAPGVRPSQPRGPDGRSPFLCQLKQAVSSGTF